MRNFCTYAFFGFSFTVGLAAALVLGVLTSDLLLWLIDLFKTEYSHFVH